MRSSRQSTARALALAAIGVLTTGVLAGCGSGSSTVAQDPGNQDPGNPGSTATTGASDPSTSPSGPSCSSVWRAGATLPPGYHGCTASARWVKAQVYQCEDGHHLVTYAHAYYATPGRSIARAATTLAKDHDFRHTMSACGA
jgi:hypothetical protein